MNIPDECECSEKGGFCEVYGVAMAPQKVWMCRHRPAYRKVFAQSAVKLLEYRADPANYTPPEQVKTATIKVRRTSKQKPRAYIKQDDLNCPKTRAQLNRLSDIVERCAAPFIEMPIEQKAKRTDFKWSVGVTTAPREAPTIGRSISSLFAAGWDIDEVTVFAEPGSFEIENTPSVFRYNTLGAWPNWFEGLRQLVEEQPDASAYLMCQDDVVYCKGLRSYIERALWPDDPERVCCVSLYCSTKHIPTSQGYTHWFPPGNLFWGALALVFPPNSAKQLIASQIIHSQRLGVRPSVGVDARISRLFTKESGRSIWFFRPSLADHIGEVSTIGHGGNKDKDMHAGTFVGEEYNADGDRAVP